MATEPAVGLDANGNPRIVEPAGSATFWGAYEPGYLVAFGISPSAVTTVTTSVSATSTVAAPSGFPAEAFYSAVGVAVIFIIATGVLAVRRRKPVS